MKECFIFNLPKNNFVFGFEDFKVATTSPEVKFKDVASFVADESSEVSLLQPLEVGSSCELYVQLFQTVVKPLFNSCLLSRNSIGLTG